MIEIIFEKWHSFSKILFITIIFIMINGYLILKALKQYFKNNWKKYRSVPYIIPFAGFINPIPGKSAIQSTIHNLISIMWSIITKYLNILIKPFYIFFSIVETFLKDISNVLNQFRTQFKIMRNFLLKMIQNIMNRLETITSTFAYLFLKLRDGLKKQFGLFNLLSWTIVHFYYFMYSMLHGPMGKFANFAENSGLRMATFTFGSSGPGMWYGGVCFDPNTNIQLLGNIYKTLSNIDIGDILYDNSVVLSTLEFDISNSFIKVYNYKGVIVSGDHLVQENNILIRVENSKYSTLIQYSGKKLICLVTNTGYIPINHILFKDYIDTHDLNINHDIHRLIEININKYYSINKHRSSDLIWGINENTIIINNGLKTKLKKLLLGDNLNEHTIKGKIHILNSCITEYIYENNGNKILLTANQLIYEDNMWIRVSQSKYSTKTKTKDNYIHFCVNNNIINIDGILLRDFMETSDYFTNNLIDNIVDNS